MGFAGLSLAWRRAEYAVSWDPIASTVIAFVAAAVFIVVLVFYFLKLLLHPGAVKAELTHPVKLHFFPPCRSVACC